MVALLQPPDNILVTVLLCTVAGKCIPAAAAPAALLSGPGAPPCAPGAGFWHLRGLQRLSHSSRLAGDLPYACTPCCTSTYHDVSFLPRVISYPGCALLHISRAVHWLELCSLYSWGEAFLALAALATSALHHEHGVERSMICCTGVCTSLG